VLEKRVVGGAHLKMKVRPRGGRQAVEAIAFNQTAEDLPDDGNAHLLYRLDINRWRGNESCQLMVERIVRG